MHRQYFRLTLFTVFVMLLLISCGLLPPTPAADIDAVYTEAARTVSVQLTQQAFGTLVAQLTQIATNYTPTPTTGVIVQTPGQTPIAPTNTMQAPPQPPAASPTPPPPPTATTRPVRCNQAAFVKDVTVSDGTVFSPGAEFTKVWRLHNSGSCTWDTSYSLVFVDGDRLARRSKRPPGWCCKTG